MHPNNLKSGWQQFKVRSSFQEIPEKEILAILALEPTKTPWPVFRRITQNTLLYAFLLLCFNGGCAV